MSRNAYINKDIPLSKIHEVKAESVDYVFLHGVRRPEDRVGKL